MVFEIPENVEKDINIILLGESGVGKSTFINSLVNYLNFSSLDEAEKGELKHLIPFRFSLPNSGNSGQRTTVTVGDDDNERRIDGLAGTCSAKDHTVMIENLKLTIIDTPGVADPDGYERDRQNMENTIEFLSKYERIHGICVLLKPNDSRLNVQFKYCFKELLVHLHKNACPNIVFCFTNTRATFYHAGDTYPILQKLVESVETESDIKIPFDNNIFCFDNEAFRYLAALRNGVQFDDNVKKEYLKSWDKSSYNAKEMLKYITKLNFHDVTETLMLNKIREITVRLAKPLAEISQNIQTNIKLAEDKKSELDGLDSNSDDLNRQLNLTQVDLKRVQLEHRRTVCTHETCVKVFKIGLTQIIDYPTHCHPHCHLDGFETDTINCPALKGCACMNEKQLCIHENCSHDWSQHMHVTYENKKIEVVQDLINEKKNKKEDLKKSLEQIKKIIEKLKYEQKVITQVSSKLAYHTRKNAIAVFNNDLEAYLDLLIKEEEIKLRNESNNTAILDGLKNVKYNYIESRIAFERAEEAASNTNEPLTTSNIYDLIETLYNLPINGSKLKDIINLPNTIRLSNKISTTRNVESNSEETSF